MKLSAIFARDVEPLRLVQIGDLSDVVVIAGPNGVGKTRLLGRLLQHFRDMRPSVQYRPDKNFFITLKSTNNEETTAWGKETIATNNKQDIGLLQGMMFRQRKRSHYSSGILNFESNRTILHVQPFDGDSDFNDPFQAETAWDIGMDSMTARFNDTVNSLQRKLRMQDHQIVSHYRELDKETDPGCGEIKIDRTRFPDHLEEFKALFSQILAPKKLLDFTSHSRELQFRADNGQTLPVACLSSGEREVVNIVFDFWARLPTDCIVIFDEPELHLHPELSYRLLQTGHLQLPIISG